MSSLPASTIPVDSSFPKPTRARYRQLAPWLYGSKSREAIRKTRALLPTPELLESAEIYMQVLEALNVISLGDPLRGYDTTSPAGATINCNNLAITWRYANEAVLGQPELEDVPRKITLLIEGADDYFVKEIAGPELFPFLQLAVLNQWNQVQLKAAIFLHGTDEWFKWTGHKYDYIFAAPNHRDIENTGIPWQAILSDPAFAREVMDLMKQGELGVRDISHRDTAATVAATTMYILDRVGNTDSTLQETRDFQKQIRFALGTMPLAELYEVVGALWDGETIEDLIRFLEPFGRGASHGVHALIAKRAAKLLPENTDLQMFLRQLVGTDYTVDEATLSSVANQLRHVPNDQLHNLTIGSGFHESFDVKWATVKSLLDRDNLTEKHAVVYSAIVDKAVRGLSSDSALLKLRNVDDLVDALVAIDPAARPELHVELWRAAWPPTIEHSTDILRVLATEPSLSPQEAADFVAMASAGKQIFAAPQPGVDSKSEPSKHIYTDFTEDALSEARDIAAGHSSLNRLDLDEPGADRNKSLRRFGRELHRTWERHTQVKTVTITRTIG